MIRCLLKQLAAPAIFAGACAISAAIGMGAARADKIKHSVAVFAGLDKITGRTIAFQAAAGETVQFGSLQITERVCYTRPATEAPQTTTFVEVDEVDTAKYKRIFTGWMFAASPGLHGIEHPIYDIWLTGCAGGGEAEASPGAPAGVVAPAAPAETPAARAKVAPAPPESPQIPAKQTSRQPRRGEPSENHAPANGEKFGESMPDQPNAEVPSLGPPVEVGPPPGFIPAPHGKRRPPVQRYYPAPPAPIPDPAGDGF
ncbi:MAG: DUF2155 domain-containing protein [Methylocella sp.]